MVVSMTLEELEKMAQQTAAFGVHPNGEFIYSFYTEQLQALARLIAEHEREACAQMLEAASKTGKIISCTSAAKTIRARGQA